ncbi:MAG: glycoside hydrolase family 32 protein [Armatimonas sp.]
MSEPWRPRFHFTPEKGWMNDPNGLVYFDGEWHLFFQWEWPRHWGHAVSKDLVHWEELPPAILPETKGGVWSGSAVARGDEIVAIFTEEDGGVQYQSIAVSDDKGRTFTRYAGNPVLREPIKDFRDPAVFWHEPTERWVMVVSIGAGLRLYGSANLTQWEPLSEFHGLPPEYIWECPDLFLVDGRWVLSASLIEPQDKRGELPGALMRYWVGDFDGVTFTPETEALILDYGPDFYAAIAYRDSPQPTMIAWMIYPPYAGKTPNFGWQGTMSAARTLSLRGDRLIQTPVAPPDAIEVVEFDSELPAFWRIGEVATLTYTPASKTLVLERFASPQLDHPEFARRTEAVLDSPGELILVRDSSSIEIFADNGAAVFTALLF